MSLVYGDIIKKMSLEEKARMMSGKNMWETVDFEKYGIPSLFLSDGPHGIRRQAGKGDQLGLNGSLPATCFPTAAGIANTWDEELGEEIGKALAEEALSMGVNVILGPGLNIKRSPLCGRNFEYFSEDPYLAGKMAASYIKGIQSKGVAACPKHFAVNSQELRRMAMDSVVDERTFREIYLTGFEIAVKEGKAKSIMSSYNQINGVYANENEHMLKEILKDDWGFEGFVVSDWGGSNDHALGVKNGSHLEMPGTGKSGVIDILRAIKAGTLKEEELDERVDELLRVIFDLDEAAKENARDSFDIEAHHALARKAAAESAVLLKNDNNILPLKHGENVLIMGDFAKVPRYQGAGSSLVNPTKSPENIMDEIKKSSLNVTGFVQGYERNAKHKQHLIDQAVVAAKQAKASGDTILIFAGLDEISETEGMDRSHMNLPDAQNKLIEAVLEVTDKVVVVLSAGSAVTLPWADKVPGILHRYLGGQAGASAAVAILTGDMCPGGRLNESYPYKYEDTPAYNYYPSKERSSEHREGLFVGYRYYETAGVNVRYPFGYGLSYTTFEYSNLSVNNDGITLKLRNTGNHGGSEVVQLYIGRKSDNIFRPVKELKGFKRVSLAVGEEKEVTIPFDDKTFRFFDVRTNSWAIEDGEYEIMVGSNVRDIKLTGKINIDGNVNDCGYDATKLSSYFTGNIKNVSDEEFRKLYGREIPDGSFGDVIDINTAVCELHRGKGILGKALCSFLEHLIKKSEKKGKPNLNALFNYNMPIRGFAKMTGGLITMDMARALTEMANGRRIVGTGHLIKAIFVRK